MEGKKMGDSGDDEGKGTDLMRSAVVRHKQKGRVTVERPRGSGCGRLTAGR